MRKVLFVILAVALQAMFQSAGAQTFVWAKSFGGVSDIGNSVVLDSLGNIYVTGHFRAMADFDPGPGVFHLTSTNSSYVDVFILKLDSLGNLVWAKKVGTGLADSGYSIAVDRFGNVYTTGFLLTSGDFDPGPGVVTLTSAGGGDAFITKLDASGNLVWVKQWGSLNDDRGHSIVVGASGNAYITGYFSETVDFDPNAGTFNLTSAGAEDICIIKLDTSGNLVWVSQLGSTFTDQAYSIAMDDSENVFVTGTFQGSTIIAKLDSSGSTIWSKHGCGDIGRSVTVDASGNVYATGYFQGTDDFNPGSGTFNFTSGSLKDAFIIRLDASGNFVWAKQFSSSPSHSVEGFSIALDGMGDVFVAGTFTDSVDFDPGLGTNILTASGNFDAFISRLDNSGNLIWAGRWGGMYTDNAVSLVTDGSGNVFTTGKFEDLVDFDPGPGTFNLNSFPDGQAFILKLSKMPPFVLQGKVYMDLNANCSMDTSDIIIPNVLIKAEPGPYYASSDNAGNYAIHFLHTGNYTISVVTQDSLWHPVCTTSYNIPVINLPDTARGIDFAMQADHYCSRLTVDLGGFLLRPCLRHTYTVNYANTGTFLSPNAYVEIDFGNGLHPQSSTIPWSAVSGNIYTFPLGNLNVNQGGSFRIVTQLDCSVPIRSTHCVTTHIYPDTVCLPPPAGWDKSELKVNGSCLNDSLVCFRIKNRSQSPMTGSSQWRLFVNDMLVAQENYQLAGSDSLIKCYPANGKTYRFEADQRPGYPHNTISKAIIEACGSPANFGFVNTVPQEDAELFIEIFCMEVTGSFDPNDKQVTPSGITSNQYITADDELEYLIRFQNTGNDTAFKVVISDTIATHVLDIATLSSGASSHDYTFNIYGQGIAEWTFDNILLPDSNINEPASHGFVKFKIQQLSGNPDGTRIQNRAAIYFDFNAPVITNAAWNVVNETALPESFLTTAINSATDITCHGDSSGTASASARGGLAPYQYLWSDSTTTATATGLVAGDYSVTITDGTGTALTDSVTISEPSALQAQIDSFTNVLCYANGTGTATASASGGIPPYSYEWSNHGSAFATATSLNAGVYWVTVWDANLCTVTTSSVTITEPSQLFANVSTQSSVTCFGGNDAAAKAGATGGVPPYLFHWSSGDTASTADNLSAGDYQITVTDSNGCYLITSVTIQDGYLVNTGPISGADTADINQSETYTVNPGFSYSWSATGGTILSGQNTNSIEVDWNSAGQGTVEVTAFHQGCTYALSKTITLVEHTGMNDYPLSDITIIPNPTNVLVHIQWRKDAAIRQITLSDVCGKRLNEFTVDNQRDFTISLRDFESGIYLLTLQGNGQRTVRLVKTGE